MKSPELLIASIGNAFHEDHAFGGEIVQRLSDFIADEHVRITDFGMRRDDLVDALLDDCDVAILIDSTPQPSPPDSVQLLELRLNEWDETTDIAGRATNSVDPIAALKLAKAKQCHLAKAYLIRREPANWPNMEKCREASVELTEAAVRESIGMITTLMSEIFSPTAAAVEQVLR